MDVANSGTGSKGRGEDNDVLVSALLDDSVLKEEELLDEAGNSTLVSDCFTSIVTLDFFVKVISG